MRMSFGKKHHQSASKIVPGWLEISGQMHQKATRYLGCPSVKDRPHFIVRIDCFSGRISISPLL
jgi:hypothetical protein